MPRAIFNLQDTADLRAVQGQWRFAPGFVPGEPNEGLVPRPRAVRHACPTTMIPAGKCVRILPPGVRTALHLPGTALPLPETVQGREVRGTRLLFETCIDDYGEIWINGACDRERGAVQGFNTPQRVLVTTDPQPGQRYTFALLAVNGPLGEPGGSVFVRSATLAFEWPTLRS